MKLVSRLGVWAVASAMAGISVMAADSADLIMASTPNTTLERRGTKQMGKRSGFSGTATWYDVETWVAGYVRRSYPVHVVRTLITICTL